MKDSNPYPESFRLPTEAEKDNNKKPEDQFRSKFHQLIRLFDQAPDDPFKHMCWGGNPDELGMTQLDRMFYEEHVRVRIGTWANAYIFKRLEPTVEVRLPAHLSPEIVAERMDIEMHYAIRLVDAFRDLQLDWKSVWHYIAKHVEGCYGNDEMLERTVSYYEVLADNMEEIEPIMMELDFKGISVMNLFFAA